jgi:hypothetical protein
VAVGAALTACDGVHALPASGVLTPGAGTPGVVVPGLVVPGTVALPAEGAAAPVLALALEAPASVNAARLGSIRWATRTVSFVGLRG